MRMKKRFLVMLLFALLFCRTVCGEKTDILTYAVFPYLPDVGYYQSLIEARWAELEPDIHLVRAEWNCYKDGGAGGHRRSEI